MQNVSAAIAAINTSSFDLNKTCEAMDNNELVEFAKRLNEAYRHGKPLVSDADYDHVVLKAIEFRDPENPFLHQVEDEGEDGGIAEGKTVTLPAIMLSTNKAYGRDTVDAWINRLVKSASEIGIPREEIIVRVTPKLDGFASYDDGTKMYTRGNGLRGTDISYVVENGLKRFGNAERGLGAGEIVVDPEYFEANLSGHFSNTRNVISGVLRTSPEPLVRQAILDGGVVFAPFKALKDKTCSLEEFESNYDEIIDNAKKTVNFDIDGVIVEATDESLKQHMGATQKAHRWMIALKENEAPVSITVLSVTPQTSRKGRVVPVLELEPTVVTGVTVSRVTGHNYSNIIASGIGKGTVIKLVRSGLVIPKIVGIETPAEPDVPEFCPSCGEALVKGKEEDGTELDLVCENTASCPAQAYKRLLHWFTTLENVDGFGPSTLEKLIKSGTNSISEIYQMSVSDFISKGFGEKTSENLVSELERSRTEAVEDYRFLAGFGIRTLGKSMSEKILSHHKMDDIFDLSVSDLTKINTVGDVKAKCISEGLSQVKDAYEFLHKTVGFNLTVTPLLSEKEDVNSPIAGKTLVFTGTMLSKSRSVMTKEAKAMGANVGSGVTSKTDFLVIGEKVGASKTNAAKKHGTKILTEAEYIKLLEN